MKYVGSKNRYAKLILPIILKDRNNSWYVEPFCGACNLLDKVDGDKIGNDSHYYLISLFKAVQKGWTPPDFVSEELYNIAKNYVYDDCFSSALVGFIGFGCSFSGKWFGGYARGKRSNGTPRNYCLESKKNILKQRRGLSDAILTNFDYKNTPMPDNSIIYCDPPYASSQEYSVGKFNHSEFWEWCRNKVYEGHRVFVSEYNAPDDFKEVWCKKVYNTLDKNTGAKTGVERLFVYNG